MKKVLQVLALFIIVAMGVTLFIDRPEKKHKDVGLWTYVPFQAYRVYIENDNISNANANFIKGQSCVIEFGGKIAVVKVSGANHYTLRYDGPQGKNGTGEACGNGTLYRVVGRPNLEQMTKSYLETVEITREEMGNIVGVLNSGPIGKPFIVKEDAYVVIKNLDGIKNRSGYREFNEMCSIRAGGRLEPLGAVVTRGDVRILHEYWNPGGRQGIGGQCGNGTLIYY
jgi:hypothetical protein